MYKGTMKQKYKPKHNRILFIGHSKDATVVLSNIFIRNRLNTNRFDVGSYTLHASIDGLLDFSKFMNNVRCATKEFVLVIDKEEMYSKEMLKMIDIFKEEVGSKITIAFVSKDEISYKDKVMLTKILYTYGECLFHVFYFSFKGYNTDSTDIDRATTRLIKSFGACRYL